jgi:biotin synthase
LRRGLQERKEGMMRPDEILRWLREPDEGVLDELWRRADQVRREQVGDAVHLRGLIEISNHCARRCAYCGLRADNADLARYRMTVDEILACAGQAVGAGYGTVVLQSGEDPALTTAWVGDLVRRIKAEVGAAVTLSVGERPVADLEAWRAAGADRYLLRFETSNPALFARIHPPRGAAPFDRLAMLRQLRDLGYEVGSGVMVGVPGETYADLVRDVELFAELDLDMIGIGPFIPHPGTPLGRDAAPAPDQVPATELMTYKAVALARLVCPAANIPSTSALATLNLASGRELALGRGANILMPVMTPVAYRARYEIYPGKACASESAAQCERCVRGRILALGRPIGVGRGDSPRWRARVGAAPEADPPSPSPRRRSLPVLG